MKDNKKFYEVFDWEGFEESSVKQKTEKILSMIPSDTRTIVDIGCGNGHITNELGLHYDVTGVDRSASALKYVKTKKIEASCDNIPLPDQAFDMSFSSELLEHLEDDVFQRTIGEIKRLSRKYVFISVPNGENIEKFFTECPGCHFRYSISYHLRSLDLEKIKKIFPEYKVLNSSESGLKVRYYNPTLARLKHRFSPAISWIPYYWIPREKRKTMCPKCELQFEFKHKFHPVAFAFDALNVLISPKKPYWIMVLLEKN